MVRPSPQPKRHLDRFSPFCTDDVRRVSLYFTTGRPFFPSKFSFPMEGIWTPPSNTWFPGSTRILNPNGISFGAAVFAGLTVYCESGAAAVPLAVRRDGPLSNVLLPGPTPNSIPSGILIHTTVWHQHIDNKRHTDRHTDNGRQHRVKRFSNCRPKWLNRWRCRLGCGSGMPKEPCIAWGHSGIAWQIQLNCPCAAAMRPYVKSL